MLHPLLSKLFFPRIPLHKVKAAREELLVLSKAKNQHSDHCFWAALLDTYRVTKSTRDKKELCDVLGLSFVRMTELVALRKQLGDSVSDKRLYIRRRKVMSELLFSLFCFCF